MEIEARRELASIRLEVAEELGWGMAILAGLAAQGWFGIWWLSALALLLAYFLTTRRYIREHNAAEDEYDRAHSLGRYYSPDPE